MLFRSRIEQVATPHEIFAKPANLFVASFIGTPQMNLLPAVCRAIEDGQVRFRVDAQEVVLPMEPPTLARLGRGAKVTLGVRPRAFELTHEPAEGTLSAVADLIEPMGAETLVHMLEGERDIRVVVERTRRVRPGERLHMRPKPGQVHVFDETGGRISA